MINSSIEPAPELTNQFDRSGQKTRQFLKPLQVREDDAPAPLNLNLNYLGRVVKLGRDTLPTFIQSVIYELGVVLLNIWVGQFIYVPVRILLIPFFGIPPYFLLQILGLNAVALIAFKVYNELQRQKQIEHYYDADQIAYLIVREIAQQIIEVLGGEEESFKLPVLQLPADRADLEFTQAVAGLPEISDSIMVGFHQKRPFIAVKVQNQLDNTIKNIVCFYVDKKNGQYISWDQCLIPYERVADQIPFRYLTANGRANFSQLDIPQILHELITGNNAHYQLIP